jgi:hypothetical protein
MEQDAFLVADEVERTFATVTFIAKVSVEESHSESALPGSSSITATVEDLVWGADGYWDMGSYVAYEGPTSGAEVTLVIDDDWGIEAGQEAMLAVTTIAPPIPSADGYVKLALNADGSARPGVQGRIAKGLNAYLAAGVEIGALSRSETVVRLVEDARDWIDRSNRNSAGQVPGGLLHAIAVRNEQANEVAQDDWAHQDPEYRQLPQSRDEIPGLENAVGREVVESEFLVVLDDVPQEEWPTFIGVRFPSVGVLGPFSVESDIAIADLLGVMPTSGAAQILAWYDEEPLPGEETKLMTLTIPPHWDPAAEVLMLTLSSNVAKGHGGLEGDLESAPTSDAEALITARVSAIDPGPRPEGDS